MSQGYLLFAHDNEEIDYALLAAWCAKRIQHWLDRPVSLVADAGTIDKLGSRKELFDQIIESTISLRQSRRYFDRHLSFNNYDRVDAWNLTPYDETVVLDTDIVIQSNIMNQVWGSNESLLLCETCADSFDIYNSSPAFLRLNEYGINFFWATQFYFRKDQESKKFFQTCEWIRQNYKWLSSVYGVDSRLIRNDYIWSIAAHMLDIRSRLPWTLLYSTGMHSGDKINIHAMTDDTIILYNQSFGVRKISSRDIHVMNKFDLQTFAEQEMQRVYA